VMKFNFRYMYDPMDVTHVCSNSLERQSKWSVTQDDDVEYIIEDAVVQAYLNNGFWIKQSKEGVMENIEKSFTFKTEHDFQGELYTYTNMGAGGTVTNTRGESYKVSEGSARQNTVSGYWIVQPSGKDEKIEMKAEKLPTEFYFYSTYGDKYPPSERTVYKMHLGEGGDCYYIGSGRYGKNTVEAWVAHGDWIMCDEYGWSLEETKAEEEPMKRPESLDGVMEYLQASIAATDGKMFITLEQDRYVVGHQMFDVAEIGHGDVMSVAALKEVVEAIVVLHKHFVRGVEKEGVC
jgi:hypothetical protein